MAEKRVGSRGGVVRTYGRVHPLRRVQPQKWFSPAEREHLFSSSSSSSHRSSSCEASSSGDSDFVPPKRKVSVACKREILKPLPQRRTLSRTRKKRLQPPKKKNQRKSESNSKREEKENGVTSERNPTSPAVFSTPFRRFVTYRRKGPGVNMKPQSVKTRKEELPLMSPDSLCDFETYDVSLSKKRRLCTDVTNILDSSVDTLHSPLQKAPLLSSTPSVLLTAMPRRGNTFVRQLALCESLEESVVRCCAETGFPCEVDESGMTPHDDIPSRVATLHSVGIISHSGRSTARQLSSNNTSEFSAQSIQKKSADTVSGSGVKCVRIGIESSGLCLLSPVMVTSSISKSVICTDEGKLTPSHQEDVDDDDVFGVSSELFSSEEKNEMSVVCIQSPLQHNDTTLIKKRKILEGRPSVCYLRGISPDRWKRFNKNTFQPVVRLNSESVTKYFQKKPEMALHSTGVFQKETNDHLSHVGSGGLSIKDVCLPRMQPVVHLESISVRKHLLEKEPVSGDIHVIDPLPNKDASGIRCHSPASQTIMKTPLVTASVVKSKVHDTAGTGRKVCISGFSAKRWGNLRKKVAKAQQHLSFQDSSEVSMLRFKEDVSVCGALSSSLLFSSSLLTSSFMNSTAVKNLNLSTESLTIQDSQREHQRWARLRAALSLHRKKKVEAGLMSNYPVDRRNRKTSLSSRNSSLLLLSPFQSSLCADELSDAEKVYAECRQDSPITFYQCLSQDQLSLCQKVGEGVYGEVFRTMRGQQHVALKVIPIEGSQKVNGEYQKSFAEILPEIIISKELSLLSGCEENRTSGFIKLHSAHCVQGSYPTELLSAWDTYAEEKGTENERPDLFGSDQLFMILEFEFGGEDLERMSSKLPSASVSRSILHQVTAALAVAEEELRFEHRDLHWGNLLIEKSASRTLSASLQGQTFHIPSAGIQVKIIDYTLSRLDKDGLTVFCDLSTDEELFLGEGDLQFDVYRNMREENENSWSSYRPHSNVLWLHYLCDKLLNDVHYMKKPASHRKELRRLQNFRRDVQQFGSATEVLQRSKLFN